MFPDSPEHKFALARLQTGVAGNELEHHSAA
jgi:hypothetical protein